MALRTRSTPRTPRFTDTNAQIGNHQFAFRRRTYEPATGSRVPLLHRVSRVSMVVGALFSSDEGAAKGQDVLGTRELLSMKNAWGAGKEVPRTLERRVSEYLSNPKRAGEMNLVYWMQEFRAVLDIHAAPGTPAEMQKNAVIRRAEKAILSFSARCSEKAVRLNFESPQQMEVQVQRLVEISIFLKRIVGMLSDDGDTVLGNDIDNIDRVTGAS